METQVRAKRKRSTIACTACHNRKVRCNASIQGIPCSNCHEDGIACVVYRKSPQIPARRVDSNATSANPPSPPLSTRLSGAESQTPSVAERTPDGRNEPLTTELNHDKYFDRHKARVTAERNARPAGQSSIDVFKSDVRPFFAGESEGLEFLFDVVCPDRPIKGQHYATPAPSYRAKRVWRRQSRFNHHLPPAAVQHELISCFFQHVWPLLPIIDAREFLTSYHDSKATPLLLWSVFFSAANYISVDVLKAHRLPPRKGVREQFYQTAKELFDSQEEDDKTVLIQAAILLGNWYIDLEDRDGMTHWLGIALSLSFTMGLHRRDNYDLVTPSPFPQARRRLWKNLWWCIMYRETWTAFAFGRPMRVDSDDCDVTMPTARDVYGDAHSTPSHLMAHLPPDQPDLAGLFVNLLELSLLLERVVKRWYRPRSFVPSPYQIEQEETQIYACWDRVQHERSADRSLCLRLNTLHMKTYYSTVLIALYRAFLAAQVSQTTSRRDVHSEIARKAKSAAADVTNVINEIISKDAIDVSPSMLVTAMMAAMQIYVWQMKHSFGMDRNYASNQLDLHMLVLSQLRKTFWTADLQHNLFVEALKVMENVESTMEKSGANIKESQETTESMELPSQAVANSNGIDGNLTSTMEDFLLSFNPFMGLSMPGDELNPVVDWQLSSDDPLGLGDVSQPPT